MRPSLSHPPRSAQAAARTPSRGEAASCAAFDTPIYVPQPESAAVAGAVDLMHTGEESEDDSFGGSPQLPEAARRKSTGEYDAEDDAEDDADFSDDDDALPPNGEVSKYTFFARLTHYMEGAKITQQNRKAVEIAILVEAGTSVRNMDAMKKTKREEKLFSKYVSIINEIEDDRFGDDSVRRDMLHKYKGAKAPHSGANLLRKLDLEMRDIRKFAAKFPGFNNPAELPSGTTQLRHMKKPVIAKLWRNHYPVMSSV